MSEIEVKYAARYIKRKRSVAIGKSLLKTLTEPITNSDDSYRVLAARSGKDAIFPLTLIVNKKKRVLRLIDNAEGMTSEDLKNKFKEYGAAKSAAYEGFSTRGLFGQGISDVLLYHQKGIIKSIKNGEASVCSFYEKKGRPFIKIERQRGKIEEISKDWGIDAAHGTTVEFIVDDDTPIHDYDNLIKRLSSFYMLRLINSNEKRTIKLIYIDLKGKKQSRVQYRFPDGEVVEHKEFTMQFEDYDPVKIDIELRKSPVPLQTAGDERENGLLVFDNENAVYDLTFFDLDNLPSADRYFGLMKLTGAREVILHKINQEKNPEEILSDSRDGFNKQHEFYKQLSITVKDWLYPILIEGKKKRTDEGISESTKENHKKAFDELNKLYEQLTGEDTRGTIKGKKTKNRPTGGIEFARPNITVTAGRRYNLQLLIDTKVIKKGTKIVLSSSRNNVGFTPTTIEVSDPMEGSDGILYKTIVITGSSPKTADTLEAKAGNRSTSVVISVVSEEIIYPENGMIFSPDYVRAIVGRESNLSLYVDLTTIRPGSKIHFSSSNNSIVLRKKSIAVPRQLRNKTKVVRMTVPFVGEVNKESGFIEAVFDEYINQCHIDVRDRIVPPPPKGPTGKFKDWAFDDTVPLTRQATYDPVPNSPTQGYILINSNHPINKLYFGENPSKIEVEKSHKAQLYLAELILSESLQQMIPEAFQKGVLPHIYGPEYDILTYIGQKKSEFGPAVYGYFVEPSQKGRVEALETAAADIPSDLDLVTGLDDRERQMVEMRFGLKEHRPHTLDDIARKFDITRERVRQIINAALAKKYGFYSYMEEDTRDYIHEQERKIGATVENIVATVAKFYNLDIDEIKTKTRRVEIVKPRQICIYLIRDIVGLSFPSIGSLFKLDHTTVLYAFEKIGDEILTNEIMKGQIESLKAILNNPTTIEKSTKTVSE